MSFRSLLVSSAMLVACTACGSDSKEGVTDGSGGRTGSGGSSDETGGSDTSGGRSGGETDGGATGGTSSGGSASSSGGSTGGGGSSGSESGGKSSSGGASATGGSLATGGAGGAAPDFTSTGEVDGVPFEAKGVMGLTAYEKFASGGVSFADFSNVCGRALESTKRHLDYANAHSLLISFGQLEVDEVTPGTFPIVEGTTAARFAQAQFKNSAADCSKVNHDATAGSIELTRVDSDGMSGSFTLTLENGDTLSGTFDTSLCNDLLTAKKDADAPATRECLPRPE